MASLTWHFTTFSTKLKTFTFNSLVRSLARARRCETCSDVPTDAMSTSFDGKYNLLPVNFELCVLFVDVRWQPFVLASRASIKHFKVFVLFSLLACDSIFFCLHSAYAWTVDGDGGGYDGGKVEDWRSWKTPHKNINIWSNGMSKTRIFMSHTVARAPARHSRHSYFPLLASIFSFFLLIDVWYPRHSQKFQWFRRQHRNENRTQEIRCREMVFFFSVSFSGEYVKFHFFFLGKVFYFVSWFHLALPHQSWLLLIGHCFVSNGSGSSGSQKSFIHFMPKRFAPPTP